MAASAGSGIALPLRPDAKARVQASCLVDAARKSLATMRTVPASNLAAVREEVPGPPSRWETGWGNVLNVWVKMRID
jgi:hypothetical protein